MNRFYQLRSSFLGLYLILSISLFSQQDDFTWISTNSAYQDLMASSKNHNLFLIGGSRLEDDEACAHGWVEAYNQEGTLEWRLTLEDTRGVSKIVYDTTLHTFWIGLGSAITDVLREKSGYLLQVDTLGNILSRKKLDFDLAYFSGLTITGDHNIVYPNHKRLTWLNKNGDSLFSQTFIDTISEDITALRTLNDSTLILTTRNKLLLLDNSGSIRQSYSFPKKSLLRINSIGDTIFTVHKNSVRRLVVSTQDWNNLNFDTTLFQISEISLGTDYAYLLGRRINDSIPIYVPFDKSALFVNTEFDYPQKNTRLFDVSHFHNQTLIFGEAEYYKRVRITYYLSYYTRNAFFHLTNIGKAPQFSNPDIAITKLKVHPPKAIDTLENTGSETVIFTAPIKLEVEVLNQGQQIIESLTLITSGGTAVECLGFTGKLQKTFNQVNLAPGEHLTIIDSTGQGRFLSNNRKNLKYLVTAYAPNQQFDEFFNDNSIVDSIDLFVSTKNLIDLPQISVFPNPTEDIINVELPNHLSLTGIEGYNLHGQLIFTQKATGNSWHDKLSHLTSGIYFLKIITSEGTNWQKIIKQ